MFNNHFITHFPKNAPVKNVENRPIFGIDIGKRLWLTFLVHSVEFKVNIINNYYHENHT